MIRFDTSNERNLPRIPVSPSHVALGEASEIRSLLLVGPSQLGDMRWGTILCRDENGRKQSKISQPFLLLDLINTKTKAKAIKLDTKTKMNLRNIENFENELIRAELCQTRSV
jgi:hypothetical protein